MHTKNCMHIERLGDVCTIHIIAVLFCLYLLHVHIQYNIVNDRVKWLEVCHQVATCFKISAGSCTAV